jgi:hypothetical protein
MLNVHYLLALVVVLGVSFMFKFVVYEGWVFVRSTGPHASDHPTKPRDAP